MPEIILLIPIGIICLPFVFIMLWSLYKKALYKLDSLTEGYFCSEEKHILAMKHFIENESEWLVKKEMIRFPKEGNMAKVAFTLKDGKWIFSDTSEYEDTIEGGYVHSVLSKEHARSFRGLRYEKIAATLYPDGVPLMLSSDSHKVKIKEREKVNIYG